MTRLSTRAHGIIDYVVGAALVLLPLLFLVNSGGRFARNEQGAEIVVTGGLHNFGASILIIAGVATLVLAALTRYELGLKPLVPMKTHLIVDAALGVFLLVSPWLLGFAQAIWWPHVLVGLFSLAVAACTRRVSEFERVDAARCSRR